MKNDISIVNLRQHENPLLNRIEIVGKIQTFGGPSPTRKKVFFLLKSKLEIEDERLLIVQKILSSYGTSEAEFHACLYDTEKDLKATERDHFVKRRDSFLDSQEE